MKTNPTDNQTPQPVDELDVIIGELCGNPQSVEQDEQIAQAKARLLQWGTRQKMAENDYHWHHQKAIEKEAKAGGVSGYFLDRKSELQASLKDGGNTE